MTSKQYLTVAEVAETLDLNHYTIRRMISRGELKAYRLGRTIRIKPADLEAALVPVEMTEP